MERRSRSNGPVGKRRRLKVRCFDLVVVELSSSSFCASSLLFFLLSRLFVRLFARLFVRAFFDFRALAKYIKCEHVKRLIKKETRARLRLALVSVFLIILFCASKIIIIGPMILHLTSYTSLRISEFFSRAS